MLLWIFFVGLVLIANSVSFDELYAKPKFKKNTLHSRPKQVGNHWSITFFTSSNEKSYKRKKCNNELHTIFLLRQFFNLYGVETQIYFVITKTSADDF